MAVLAKHHRLLLGYLRESSAIFWIFRKHLPGLWTTFREFSEIFGKCSVNRQKNPMLLVCLYKQNNTWLVVDMEFLFSCSIWYLTHLLHSFVRFLHARRYYSLYHFIEGLLFRLKCYIHRALNVTEKPLFAQGMYL